MFKKKGFAIFFVLLFMFAVSGCTSNTPPEAATDEQGQKLLQQERMKASKDPLSYRYILNTSSSSTKIMSGMS